ncbi:uncharacterized protein LOC108664843 [Hyalella azteca]|uniref:Uncharacterized protein LOC108664843 n=1 Tax=Hyalella azteca TaxID=294128 RepID=A0A8B7N0H1_HYAAZ|nr:uncharacterized protein LOC108664843 [Hyalella azteca]
MWQSLSWPLLCLLVLSDVQGSNLVYTVHFSGATLCPAFVRNKTRVGSVVMCALHASSVRAPAFAFCEGETEDCLLASSAYTAGTMAASGLLCRLYSSNSQPPLPPPKPQGKKRYKLSTAITTNGDVSSMSAENLCAADGYQFAVIASAAEQQLVFDQVGAEIKSRCTYACLAWLWLDPSYRWSDGSVLNQCEVGIGNPGDAVPCFTQGGAPGLYKFYCRAGTGIPVVCQVYE